MHTAISIISRERTGNIRMYYHIKNSLVRCGAGEVMNGEFQYVAVLTKGEWIKQSEQFDMFIDLDLELSEQRVSRTLVNYDSLTGSLSFPDRNHTEIRHSCSFALDEKGVVFIDDEGFAARIVQEIARTKRWKLPSLERFLYDFLEILIGGDLNWLEQTEKKLNHIEDWILENAIENFPAELNDIRGDLLDLRTHYEQLIDLGRELEENENGFFRTENLRFFRQFTERVTRLQDIVTSEREYIIQLRDLVQNQLSVRQNKIMTLLTVVTSIFMPLTLITGWYGMNFRYMPELEYRVSYPMVLVVCIVIVVVSLWWFRKQKWL